MTPSNCVSCARRALLALPIALPASLAAFLGGSQAARAASATEQVYTSADKHCSNANLRAIVNDFRKTIEPPIMALRDRSIFPGSQIKGAELLDRAERVEAAALSGNTWSFHSEFRLFLDDYYSYLRSDSHALAWALSFFLGKAGEIGALVYDESGRAYPNYETVPGLCNFLRRKNTSSVWNGTACNANKEITAFLILDSARLSSSTVCGVVLRIQSYTSVLLVNGEDPGGHTIYVFILVESDKLNDFMTAQHKGLFYPERYGTIVKSGNGNPTTEVYAEMKKRYGYDRNFEEDLK